MTSFGFRYLMLDRTRAPSLTSVVQRARALGFDSLQICENARPMELSRADWEDVVQSADEVGLEIQLGCKTVDLGVLRLYAERAACLPARMLRVVLERDGGLTVTRADVDAFLSGTLPLLDAHGLRLAIENHFAVSCRVLADAVAPYPPGRVGFCVDTANSLRNFEPAETVLDLLGDRAFCYHIKDYSLEGDKLGFRVKGAPLGEGNLDLDRVLDRILSRDAAPQIFVESWRSGTGDWATDVREDDAWLRHSLDTMQRRLSAIARPVEDVLSRPLTAGRGKGIEKRQQQ
jgi:sugar phosphate isomerase/epimerase